MTRDLKNCECQNFTWFNVERGVTVRGLKIKAVVPESPGSQAGLLPGDRLVAIGGRPVRDIIDYYFWLAVAEPVLTVKRDEAEFTVRLEEDVHDLGLSFTTPFGRVRRCANHCLFCFVDQQPPGLRPSLRFKDDDYRLSFWEGNFITLTNCTPRDLTRIIEQRLSPLYVSVHTTNPELRARMMGNPQAAKINAQLRELAAGGITLHTQIVLCPGLNDGEELDRTVCDLAALFPAVRSVAIVPVGLTRYREGLYPLRPVTRAEAVAVLAKVTAWQQEFHRRYGSRLVFASDEFYLLAGKEIPAAKEYEGFPQLENGVGLVRQFLDAWKRVERRLPARSAPCRALLLTGTMAVPILQSVVDRLNAVEGLDVTLLPVKNVFFGDTVTVAGLLTGQDICAACAGAFQAGKRPDLIIIPAAALKERKLFLDGMTIAEVVRRLGCRVVPAADPRELVAALGIEGVFHAGKTGSGNRWAAQRG